MIVWGLNERDIYRAADRAEVRIYNLRREGKGLRFLVKPYGQDHSRLISECFKTNDRARVKTAKADYRGSTDFVLKSVGFTSMSEAAEAQELMEREGLV